MAAALVLLTGILSGCGAFSTRYRPVDIDGDMPGVTGLVQAVQAAIDATAEHPGWQPSSEYRDTADRCALGRADATFEHASVCASSYAAARGSCAHAGPVGTGALCSDYFREAAAACAAAGNGEPGECAWAKLMAPPRITGVKLRLVAASDVDAGGGMELKLLSAKASRSGARRHTLELELMPRPELQRQMLQARAEAGARAKAQRLDPTASSRLFAADLQSLGADSDVPEQARTLYQALLVALEAATGPRDDLSNARRLTLKRAAYQFEIDYKRTAKGGFAWSVAPLSGSLEAGSEQSAGNTLSIEVLR